MIIKFYRWLDSVLHAPAWLMTAMDATVASACKYCMAVRTVLFVAGVALLFSFLFVGLPLILIAVALTWGERYEHSELLKGNIKP